MRTTTFTTYSLLAAFLLCLSANSVAQDISNEQRNAYEARQTYNKKMSDHKNITERVDQQEKHVAQEQARLDKLREEQQAAMHELTQAKVDLDHKVDALNAVWDLRDQ